MNSQISRGFIRPALVIAATLTLTACQSTKTLSDEERAFQAELQQVEAGLMSSECAVVGRLNEARKLARKKVLAARDCVHFSKKGTMEGYSDKVRVPNVLVNNVILPFGLVATIAQEAKKTADHKRAVTAEVPARIASRGRAAEVVYRRLIRRGFEEAEIVAIAGSPVFPAAARAVSAAQAFAAAHRKPS